MMSSNIIQPGTDSQVYICLQLYKTYTCEFFYIDTSDNMNFTERLSITIMPYLSNSEAFQQDSKLLLCVCRRDVREWVLE